MRFLKRSPFHVFLVIMLPINMYISPSLAQKNILSLFHKTSWHSKGNHPNPTLSLTAQLQRKSNLKRKLVPRFRRKNGQTTKSNSSVPSKTRDFLGSKTTLPAFLIYRDICNKPEFQGRTKNAVSKAYKRKVQEAQETFTPEIVLSQI